MSMFGSSQREQYDALYGVLNQPADTSALERQQAPDFFEGDLGSAAGTGVFRGWSRGAATLGNVATPALRPIAKSIDDIFGSSTDEWLAGEQEKANRALIESKIDPKTTGMAGQLLYGLGDVLTTVVGTAGNPYAAGGLYGITQAQLGMAEGLDTTTAVGKGALEGLGLGVGVALAPAYGSTLVQKLLSGSAINVGIGVGTRAPVSGLLNARGYPEMARQYAPLDATSLITDAVLGAAFGGIYRKPLAKMPDIPAEAIKPSTVDAALTANQTHHAELDTAPGIPADTRSRQQHAAALDTTIEQLAMGREPNIERILEGAGFVGKRPDFDALRVITEELEKVGATDVVAKLRAIEVEAKERGLYVEPDSLGSVVKSDAPVEVSVRGLDGKEDTVRIGEDKVPVRYMLMEAQDILATMQKAENQFRDRTRMASDQQINDIASRLDPDLVMESKVMDYGAPVLSNDGVVIAGNGRSEAIRLAYEQGSAGAYRDALRAEFGEAVDSMQAPVMVRVLQREVDIAKSAILSNEGAALRMSALEQAKVDAARLGDFRAFEFGEDGNLNLVSNMPFIRGWVADMPLGQRAAIMDADGRLSAEGAKRLQNAILFRAYGDSPTLGRLIEATDPGSRNIAAALTRAAPAVADAKEAIARGDLYPMGIDADLVQSVEKLEALRAAGTAVETWAKQIDAFGDGMTAEARLLVQFMDSNIRATRQISDGIFGFYNRLLEAGNPKQGSMFEAAQPDKMRMLTLALEQPAPMYSRSLSDFFTEQGIAVRRARPEQVEAYRSEATWTDRVTDPATGMPVWSNRDIKLDRPRDVTDAHDAFYLPQNGERAIKYDIRGENGEIVGYTVLEMDGDWPVRLLDIDINESLRGQRHGEKAIAAITADVGELGIWHIIPSSRSWWERIGVRPTDEHHGVLAFSDYADARAARENPRGLEGGVNARAYSRGVRATSGATAPDLITAFRAQFGRDADRLLETGRVEIVQSVKDLPGSGHPADVGGMFWQGKSWIVADNTSLSQVRGRVLHEIGEHAGMEQMLGAQLYADTLARIEQKVATDPVFAEARALAEERANKPEHVPAETLAYLVENAPEDKLVRRLLAQVRQWLYRVTGGRFVDLTQADLQMMAVAALRNYARRAEVEARGGDAPWYMTHSDLLGDWISKTLAPDALRGPTAARDVFERMQRIVRGEEFDYELRRVPVGEMRPTQFGDEYTNDSSREAARIKRSAGSMDDVDYVGDVLPVLLDENGSILDGNHRHAAAVMNGEQEIPALVPVARGSGRILNLPAIEAGEMFSRDGYPTRESVEAFHAGVESDKVPPTDPVEDTTMPGARALAATADAEIAQATELSQGFMPAVECFLQVGQ